MPQPTPLFSTGDRVRVLAGADAGRIGIVRYRFAHRLRDLRFHGTMRDPLEYVYDVRAEDGTFLTRTLAESEITGV